MAQVYDGSLVDAVRITLERGSAIAVSRQLVVIAEGGALAAQGVFDPALYASVDVRKDHTPLPTSGGAAGLNVNSHSASYQAGLTQKLRSGVTVNPALTVTRTHDNYLNTTSPSSANVALNFTLPLLRGRGANVVTAYERSAMHNYEASMHARRHAIASSMNATVLAYWDLLAARQSNDIATMTEQRATGLLADAQKLATADEIPASEVKKYEAKLLQESAGRIAAEQSVTEARNNLGLSMGLSGPEISSMKMPTDTFRKIDTGELDAATVARLGATSIAAAPALRSDVRALDSQLDGAAALLVAANDAQKPQLDVAVGVGYNGLVERRSTTAALQSLYTNLPGLNVSAGVSYAWSIGNRGAAGLSLQRSAEIERLRLERQALLDRVASLVVVRLSGVQAAAQQLTKASSEIRLQQEVYESEKRKYRFGLTTLLDLFTSEAQLTAAQLNEVAARRNLAQAMVRVRFETGTLLDESAQEQVVDYSRLVTLPRLPDANLLH